MADSIRAILNGNIQTVSTKVLNTDIWYNVVITFSDTEDGGTYYIDGLSSGTYSSANTLTSTDKLYIGASGTGTSLFNGSIDDVRIYNRALSAEEITRLYDMGR